MEGSTSRRPSTVIELSILLHTSHFRTFALVVSVTSRAFLSGFKHYSYKYRTYCAQNAKHTGCLEAMNAMAWSMCFQRMRCGCAVNEATSNNTKQMLLFRLAVQYVGVRKVVPQFVTIEGPGLLVCHPSRSSLHHLQSFLDLVRWSPCPYYCSLSRLHSPIFLFFPCNSKPDKSRVFATVVASFTLLRGRCIWIET